MQSKSLLIAIAAFAVTTTGVYAYGGGSKLLTRAGLTEEQVSALEEAHELRANGDFTGARNKLVEVGISEETLHAIRQAAHESRIAMRDAIHDGDYEAFRLAVQDTPLGDIITSEADFQTFREAHELKMAGQWEDAHVLMEGLGIEGEGWESHRPMPHHRILEELSSEQREAFLVAKQANDRATMQAILDEAGVKVRGHHGHSWLH